MRELKLVSDRMTRLDSTPVQVVCRILWLRNMPILVRVKANSAFAVLVAWAERTKNKTWCDSDPLGHMRIRPKCIGEWNMENGEEKRRL